MRHVSLTCKNHPELRWSCKEIAFTDEGGYNGIRSLSFKGKFTGMMYSDNSGVDCDFAEECNCPVSDLIRADEDSLIKKDAQHHG